MGYVNAQNGSSYQSYPIITIAKTRQKFEILYFLFVITAERIKVKISESVDFWEDNTGIQYSKGLILN